MRRAPSRVRPQRLPCGPDLVARRTWLRGAERLAELAELHCQTTEPGGAGDATILASAVATAETIAASLRRYLP